MKVLFILALVSLSNILVGQSIGKMEMNEVVEKLKRDHQHLYFKDFNIDDRVINAVGQKYPIKGIIVDRNSITILSDDCEVIMIFEEKCLVTIVKTKSEIFRYYMNQELIDQ